MSWEIVREAADLLLIKSIVKDLEERLSKEETFNPKSTWLNSSSYVIAKIKKEVVGRKVKNELLKSVYYLRCLYYWKKNDLNTLDNELVNVIFEEFPEEPIFNFIEGSIFIQQSLPLLSSPTRNKTLIAECFNSSFIFFNRAYNKTNDYDIKVAIDLSLMWMYHLTKREDKFKGAIARVVKNDNKKFGKGWALWLNWIGRNLSDEEIIFITNKI